MNNEYSKPEGPYERNHRTRTLSENNPKAFRKDSVRIAVALNHAGIGCELESIATYDDGHVIIGRAYPDGHFEYRVRVR